MERAYFDHAATTPLEHRVLEAMVPALRDGWSNSSGIYRKALYAPALLDSARLLSTGQFKFSFLPADGGDRILPRLRKFPAGRSPTDWLRSSEFEVP